MTNGTFKFLAFLRNNNLKFLMPSVLFSLSEQRKTTDAGERKQYNKEPPPGFQSINTRQKCCVARDTVSDTRVFLIVVVVEYD